MASTISQYIVWNNRDGKVEAGPFGTSGEADSARRRCMTKQNGLGKEPVVLTTETITSVKQK